MEEKKEENKVTLNDQEQQEIVMRQQIVLNKKNEVNTKLAESFLLEQGIKLYYNELIEKYGLDKTKNYQFNKENGILEEQKNK